MTIAEKLIKLRNTGVGWGKIAKELGVTRRTVERWRDGSRTPSPPVIILMDLLLLASRPSPEEETDIRAESG